jgi:geranylgeranyl pyrophosphate synthase
MLYGLDERTAAIYAPIEAELVMVENKLRGLAPAEVGHLRPLLDYVAGTGGKRVRPAITLLASHPYPHDADKLVLMAGAVELLHLATLIHDDTVDDSPTRRGRATVGNVWGHHVAVLFGDYVFATSATFVCDTDNIRIMRRFSETIMDLASGELIEYFGAFDPAQARELYNDRIYRKTASLFCTAGESGAVLGGAPEDEVQAMRRYGYNIGMAYQVGDDLLDFEGDETDLGKPVGSDLLHGVLTLPTIMLQERYPQDNPVSALFQDRDNAEKLQRVVDMIRNAGIIRACEDVVRDYCDRACAELKALPRGEARRSLHDLAEYVWNRRR